MNGDDLFRRVLIVAIPLTLGIICMAAREIGARPPIEQSRPTNLKVLAIERGFGAGCFGE